MTSSHSSSPSRPTRAGIGRTSPSTCSTSAVCTTASWSLPAQHEGDVLLRRPCPHPLGRVGAGQRRLQLRVLRRERTRAARRPGAAAARGSRRVARPGCAPPSAQKCCTSARCQHQVGEPPVRAAGHPRRPAVREHRLGRGVGEPAVRLLQHRQVLARAPSVLLRRQPSEPRSRLVPCSPGPPRCCRPCPGPGPSSRSTTPPAVRSSPPAPARRPGCTSAASPPTTPPTSGTRPPTWPSTWSTGSGGTPGTRCTTCRTSPTSTTRCSSAPTATARTGSSSACARRRCSART